MVGGATVEEEVRKGPAPAPGAPEHEGHGIDVGDVGDDLNAAKTIIEQTVMHAYRNDGINELEDLVVEGMLAAEPFIHNEAQLVLLEGWAYAWVTTNVIIADARAGLMKAEAEA